MKKIYVDDLDKLRITRVNLSEIYFTYDNIKYVLMYQSKEYRIRLYLRLENEARTNFKRSLVYSVESGHDLYTWIKYIGKPRQDKTFVYSQIDKEYFVKKLVEYRFAVGMFNHEYLVYDMKIMELNQQIKELNIKIRQLTDSWYETSGHGSKTNSMRDKLRISNAESITGANFGELCTEYNCLYGSVHPEYGGVLTDLYSLPVGTTFYCNNGDWEGEIGFNRRGRKVVITCKSFVELTQEFHSAYISDVWRPDVQG